MQNCRTFLARCAAVALVAGLGMRGWETVARGETLGDGWQWRRSIAFKQVVAEAPGENVAWAEFYANGAQMTDGADFRVTTADRYVLPSKVLQVSRDSDLVRIAFETRIDGPFYVWWGNPKAEKPAKDLEIKRGFMLEVSRYTGPGGGGPAAVTAVDAPPGLAMASYFLPEVNLGFNPYGDERQIMLRYSGMFKIDRGITAEMAFTVNDMGTLWIDGKQVDRQIKVGLRGQVRQSVPVVLSMGWHTLEIHQVNQAAGNLAMALAWQRPGEKAFSEFPISIFAPVARGVAGPLEKVGTGAAADVSVEPTAEGFLPPSFYGQRYTFDATFPTSARGGGGAVQWDFGDGQTVSGVKRATHMFLGPGVYPVTAKMAGTGGAESSITVRVAVKDRLYEKFPRPTEDPPTAVRTMLHEMKPDKLPTDQAFRGMSLFESVGDEEGQIDWGNAWLAGGGGKGGTVADGVIFDETFALARLELERKQFKPAAESFRLAAAKAGSMEMRCNLMRLEVMTLCDYVDDAAGAVKESQDWLKKINTGSKVQVQTTRAALAYALIARGGEGDGKAAKAAVDAAVAAGGSLSMPVARGGGAGTGNAAADMYNQKEIQQGVMTRNVENYIRTSDLDTAASLLNQWELQFPDAIWEGFTRTLRVKLAAAEGRNLVAARMALEHARANPDGFYAAELLYRAAENFKLAGEQQQAKTVMDLLASKYPESPYARQAGK